MKMEQGLSLFRNSNKKHAQGEGAIYPTKARSKKQQLQPDYDDDEMDRASVTSSPSSVTSGETMESDQDAYDTSVIQHTFSRLFKLPIFGDAGDEERSQTQEDKDLEAGGSMPHSNPLADNEGEQGEEEHDVGIKAMISHATLYLVALPKWQFRLALGSLMAVVSLLILLFVVAFFYGFYHWFFGMSG